MNHPDLIWIQMTKQFSRMEWLAFQALTSWVTLFVLLTITFLAMSR